MPVETSPEIISRTDLKTMIDEDRDFELIEVLSKEEFEEYHLPGAINIPGDRLRETVEGQIPDKNTPIVVYCADPSCTASDRAAELLTNLGYHHVFDYRGGKEHWKEGGLAVEQPSRN